MAVTITEFVRNFAETYSAVHIDDIEKGTIYDKITEEI